MILILGLILFLYVLERIITTLFGIKKKGKISETTGKKVDRWGRVIILVFYLGALPFVVTKDVNVIKWYFALYLLFAMGFQSIMEWKYLKNSKQYITTLILLMLSEAILINIEYFL